MKDGEGTVIQSYVYDPYGRVIEESDPFGTTYYNNFDAFGNPQWMQDSSGEITTSTYNANGQIQTMTENPGTPEEEISTFTPRISKRWQN